MTPPAAQDQLQAVQALLQWYVEQGIDIAVDDKPQDRFAAVQNLQEDAQKPKSATRSDTAHQRPAPVESRLAPTVSRLSPDEATQSARQMATQAGDLEALRAILAAFKGCELYKTATRIVFADGRPGARVMLVGEAPGAEEDREGLPFVGRSGQLLNRMLASIGLARQDVYITNIIPWRPPGNRTPTPQEIAICLPFIHRHIELAKPDFLICLGGPSAQTLLDVKDGITKVRGQWHALTVGAHPVRALATLHPAYLLRQPLQKRFAWRDFLALKAALEA